MYMCTGLELLLLVVIWAVPIVRRPEMAHTRLDHSWCIIGEDSWILRDQSRTPIVNPQNLQRWRDMI